MLLFYAKFGKEEEGKKDILYLLKGMILSCNVLKLINDFQLVVYCWFQECFCTIEKIVKLDLSSRDLKTIIFTKLKISLSCILKRYIDYVVKTSDTNFVFFGSYRQSIHCNIHF